ncbi:GmrSD restriction endonuclease domain-containing protein [Nonomuraea montanisoli]|uniref:GmrSD restriction endonuclease domain-containing protein n=1 Tax=Nonomuraea montanisoli TaxID=2741721 RepID=UPI0038B22F17
MLVWQRPAAAGTVHIGHLTIDAHAVGDAYWVVDGQQRITSLVGALTATGDTVDPRFRIYFDLARHQFISLPRRYQPGDDQLPMSLVLDTARTNAWIRARVHLNDEQIALADQVVAAVRDYKIPMYIVAGEDDRALRDIFDRMNTFGKPLKSAEVFNALHSIAGEQKPGDLRMLGASVQTFGFGEISRR